MFKNLQLVITELH